MQVHKLLDTIDLLCVDMYQTLVDINPRIPFIWKKILREQYTRRLEQECLRLVDLKITAQYHKITGQTMEFQDLKTLFKPYFREIKEELKIDLDEEIATRIFLAEHGSSESFPDTRLFFDQLGKRLPVCLISDTDDDMIQPLLKQYSFDSVFTSEKVRSYKGDPRGLIFKTVLDHYGLSPGRTLHIGDGISDIKGAKQLGIAACWINRSGSKWTYNIKLDYVIQKLTDLL